MSTPNMKEDTVLIPGLLCNETLFESVINLSNQRSNWHIACIDNLQSYHEMAKLILANAPPKFNLAGFSLGGWIALEIMRLAPERVQKLYLISTTYGTLLPETEKSMHQAIEKIKQGKFELYIEESLKFYLAPANANNLVLKTKLLDMMRQVGPEVAIRQLTCLITQKLSFAHINSIQCPTWIIRGAEDVRISIEMHQKLHMMIPGSKLVVIKNAGHFLPLEQPAELALNFET